VSGSESVIVYIGVRFLARLRFFDERECLQDRLRVTTRYWLNAWFNRAYLQDCASNTGAQTLISIQACVYGSVSPCQTTCFQVRVHSIMCVCNKAFVKTFSVYASV
jgi:hypothetical protein